MTDAEYLFKQDVREKKRNGYGVYHKKNGSKSKKCSLPSDKLTRKEKQALNGECVVWDYKKFYALNEFKSMPIDIQVGYINSLMNRYDIGLATISRELFGRASNYLNNYFLRLDQKQYLNTRKGPGSPSRAKAFKDAIEAYKNHTTTEKIDSEPSKESRALISDFLIRMDKFDETIWSYCKDLFEDQDVLITLSITPKP